MADHGYFLKHRIKCIFVIMCCILVLAAGCRFSNASSDDGYAATAPPVPTTFDITGATVLPSLSDTISPQPVSEPPLPSEPPVPELTEEPTAMPADTSDTLLPTGAAQAGVSDSIAKGQAGQEPDPSPEPTPSQALVPTEKPVSDLSPTPPAPTAGQSAEPTQEPAASGASPTPAADPEPTAAPKPPKNDPAIQDTAAGCSVSANGQLQVLGTQLSNQSGSPIVLRGISTAGIAWFPNFATGEFMKTFRDEWGASVFRIAMYSYEGSDSYINNPSWNKTKVCSLIDAAIELDMYVIVDWHILADGNPQTYQVQAAEFFTYIASTYPGVPNILYEICNEPNGGVSWSGNIKPYAEAIIPVIRSYSPDAVILVGTPTWSQDVDAAAEAPLDYGNIMYALHFYAGTHKEWLRGKADTALSKGLPLFVTEWGTTDASGDGNVDTASSDIWLEYLEAKGISWCNWSLCNKSEASALLLPSAGTSGAMPDSVLSASGKYVKRKLLQYGGAPAPNGGSSPTNTPVPDREQADRPDNNSQETTPIPDKATMPDNPPDTGNLLLLSYNENRDVTTNTISPRIQVKNNSGNSISLSQLAIRYYYTPESPAAQNLWCDYADVNGGTYRAITGFVAGTYQSGLESCMEITFLPDAGALSPGETVTLQLRITNEDWSEYDQGNDASFLPSAGTWQENPPLTLLIQGDSKE